MMQWKWLNFSINKPSNVAKISLVAALVIFLAFGSPSFAYNHIGLYKYFIKDTTTDAQINTANFFLNSNSIKVPVSNQAVGFVQDFSRKRSNEFSKMKIWGKPYFDLYDRILPLYGIPKELKYLSVIESSLNPGTISWAGAVGPWQLMPDEAVRFGLRNSNGIDERMDFYKSTHAAAKLIKELYNTFGDWLLVIAAYNGGVGRVKGAIEKAGSKNFWDLQYYLKEETRTHVKKYIATHYIFEGSGGLTTMTAKETDLYKQSLATSTSNIQLSTEELNNTTLVEVSGRYLSLVISNNLLMDIDQFNKWNPGFDKTLAEGKKYALRLTKDRAAIFEAKKSQLLLESIKTLLNGDKPEANNSTTYIN